MIIIDKRSCFFCHLSYFIIIPWMRLIQLRNFCCWFHIQFYKCKNVCMQRAISYTTSVWHSWNSTVDFVFHFIFISFHSIQINQWIISFDLLNRIQWTINYFSKKLIIVLFFFCINAPFLCTIMTYWSWWTFITWFQYFKNKQI